MKWHAHLWATIRDFIGNALLFAAFSMMSDERQDEWIDYIRGLP